MNFTSVLSLEFATDGEQKDRSEEGRAVEDLWFDC